MGEVVTMKTNKLDIQKMYDTEAYSAAVSIQQLCDLIQANINNVYARNPQISDVERIQHVRVMAQHLVIHMQTV